MAEQEDWQLDDGDARAEFYDKHLVPAVFNNWALLLVDAASVAPGQRILDVACGTGIVARVVADQVMGRVKTAGIDLNKSMIEVARRLCADIDWLQGNVTSIPFADESFDVVLCPAALVFFPDQVVPLQEMRRMLNSTGRIAVQVPGAMPQAFDATCETLEKVAAKEMADSWRASLMRGERSDVTSFFARADFQSLNIQTHQVAVQFPSMEAFLHACVDFLYAGRVDVDAMLTLARDRLESFCTASGAMHSSWRVTSLQP